MKSKTSWYVVGIAAICVIGMTLMMLGRREVKGGGAKMSRKFPLSVDDSVYDGEGFFEDYCACYSDYDEIRSMTVSLQGKWQSGRIYLTLVDDEGKVFWSWEYSSEQEVSESYTCNAPAKGLQLRYRVEKGAVGYWTVTFEESVFAYKKWFK